jgi:hypothetical protein
MEILVAEIRCDDEHSITNSESRHLAFVDDRAAFVDLVLENVRNIPEHEEDVIGFSFSCRTSSGCFEVISIEFSLFGFVVLKSGCRLSNLHPLASIGDKEIENLKSFLDREVSEF